MEKNKDIQRLIDAFTNIDNNEDMESFLADLCSVGELTAISERLKIASKLKNGEMYSDIASSMDVSATLIAKVDDVLKSGGKGFDIALEAIEKDEECYGSFASLYDILTYDVNYEERVEYVEKLFEKFSDIKVSSVLDLACGTGTTSIMLADKGYEVIGVDNSQEMLAVAREKQGKRDILFLNQDMDSFELYGTVDSVICLLDSVNYVLDEDALLRCFKWVNNYLNPGGIFIFDINTKHKLENVLAGNIFNDEQDGVFYSWENYYDPEENICEFDINFFVREKSAWKRFNEIHYERAYTHDEIKTLVEKAGLKLEGVYDDLSFKRPVKSSEKVFYIAKKK